MTKIDHAAKAEEYEAKARRIIDYTPTSATYDERACRNSQAQAYATLAVAHRTAEQTEAIEAFTDRGRILTKEVLN